MSDVNTFIDTIGKDVSATVVPKIESLVEEISPKTFERYSPRVSTFAGQLVKDIIDEQSATVRDFVTGVIQDVFQRYRPELAGELHTRVVPGRARGDGARCETGHQASRHRCTGVIAGHSRIAHNQSGCAGRDASERDGRSRRGAVAARAVPEDPRPDRPAA